MGRLVYFVREALRGFVQAKLMTSVAVVTVAVALFVLAVAALAAYNVSLWFKQIEQRSDMVAYVSDSLAADSVALDAVAARVREFPQVVRVGVVGKAEALERFRGMYGSEMLDMVDDNPLPASLEIALDRASDDPAAISRMASEIAAVPGIESADFSSAQAAQMRRLQRGISIAAAVLGLLCLLVLYYVVANTIKLTIYARRELVINMRYVGATDTFIATPFVIEGMLQGLLGGVLAVVAVGALRVSLHQSTAIAWGDPTMFAATIIGTGVLSACFGSVNAVRKFLD